MLTKKKDLAEFNKKNRVNFIPTNVKSKKTFFFLFLQTGKVKKNIFSVPTNCGSSKNIFFLFPQTEKAKKKALYRLAIPTGRKLFQSPSFHSRSTSKPPRARNPLDYARKGQ
jgi:hypothetical protein